MKSTDLKQLFIQYKLILIPIIIGLTAFIIAIFVLIPQFKAYSDTQKELSQSFNRAKTLEVKADELAKLDGSSSEKGLNIVSQILPSDPDVAGVIADLEDLARRSNLVVKHVGFLSSGNLSSKDNFQIEMKLGGPVENIRTFLLSLQNFKRVVQVENIVVQKLGTGTETSLPLTIYFTNSKPGRINTDQPLPVLSEDEKTQLAQLETILNASNNRQILPPPSVGSASANLILPTNSSSSFSVNLGKSNPFE